MNSHIKSTVMAFALIFALFISFTSDVSACSNNSNNCFPPVTGSCYATVSRAETGETITWRSTVSGGNGYYSYAWSGSEGLSGNYPYVSKSYSSEGTKNATVAITSYGTTITKTCSVIIEDEEVSNPDLSVSCYANPSSVDVGDSVTWTASVSGGNGSYSYSWSGTDGLSGSSRTVSKSYSSEGTKNGTVRVTSDGETETATCSTRVDEEEDDNDDLTGYCEAVSPSSPEVGDKVTWRAYPSGGDGDYDYDWSGSESLDGDERTVYKEYDNDGRKTATVRITSDGHTITKTCDIEIDEEADNNDDLDAYCKASPSSGDEGDRIKWTVYPEGGDGDYDYDWDGDDNLSGDDKSIYHTYDDAGDYDAEVEVRSDGDRVTARCDIEIDGDDRDRDDGIYLSSIPATGISPTMKTGLFATGVVLWSAFLGYLYVSRRNEKKREQEILNSLK